jgi:hypothetical protein
VPACLVAKRAHPLSCVVKRSVRVGGLCVGKYEFGVRSVKYLQAALKGFYFASPVPPTLGNSGFLTKAVFINCEHIEDIVTCM